MKFLALALLGTASGTLGPHLLGGAAEYHRGLAEADVKLQDLVAPFAGRPTIAVRVHHDNDDKTHEGVAEAVVAALRQEGLPPDPAEAAALVDSTVPLSITLQFEHLDAEAWPAAISELVAPFGETSTRAEVDGGLLVHLYISSPGAAALPSHEDVGDVLVLQLIGEKVWTVGGDTFALGPGDALSVPSGVTHAARATAAGSVHLTIHRISPEQIERRRLASGDDCYPGTDAYCSCSCDQCEYCNDAATVCRDDVPPFYSKNICCLNGGYVFETARPGECEDLSGGGDDDKPDDAVLCPGVKPGTNQFCDCSLDCREYRDKYCFCAEARAESCCGISPACVDAPEDKWTYDGGWKGQLGCAHIRNSEDKKVRDKRCARVGKNGATGAEACPKACGLCKGDIVCADDADFRYYAGDKDYVGCPHVAGGTDKEKEKRCERESDNGVKAKDACPVACGTCEQWIDRRMNLFAVEDVDPGPATSFAKLLGVLALTAGVLLTAFAAKKYPLAEPAGAAAPLLKNGV
ncbi:unnamed protein product [Pelagomonas calceolata]|uniref:Cupin type-2 domain-containing protein n=1 Tax=Pelagomonas calceolata TaxID=35677 RepID=A0A8J2X1B7_9STRA|nr:unnamed protein product [Pelagomonas calceolata]